MESMEAAGKCVTCTARSSDVGGLKVCEVTAGL